ncbi:MAG: hypothetical protein NVSMB5_16050 [Candidatus Velthaea sp.]
MQPARSCIGVLANVTLECGDVTEQLPGAAMHEKAGFGEHGATLHNIDEAQTERVFECPNLMRYGRLRDAERVTGGGKAACLCQSMKRPQLCEAN